MSNLYHFPDGGLLLLYTDDKKIRIQAVQDGLAGPRNLLAEDFEQDLESLVYHDDILYTYFSSDGQIHLRSVRDRDLLRTPGSGLSISNQAAPKLCEFAGDLLCIFAVSADGGFRICVTFPLSSQPPRIFPELLPAAPVITLVPDSECLCLLLTGLPTPILLRADKKMEPVPDRLRMQLESAKKQYNDLMIVAAKYRDEALKWRSKFL